MVSGGAPRPRVRGRPSPSLWAQPSGPLWTASEPPPAPSSSLPWTLVSLQSWPTGSARPSSPWSPALTKETRVEGAQGCDLEWGVLWGETGPSLLGVLCGDPSHVQDEEDRGLSKTCKWTQSRPASCRAWERWWPIALGPTDGPWRATCLSHSFPPSPLQGAPSLDPILLWNKQCVEKPTHRLVTSMGMGWVRVCLGTNVWAPVGPWGAGGMTAIGLTDLSCAHGLLSEGLAGICGHTFCLPRAGPRLEKS